MPFSRSVGSFRDYMIAGGARNKRAAKAWITSNVRTQTLTTELPHEADGVQGALTVAFQMEPDVIFLVSDADFQRNRPKKGMSRGTI